MLAGLRGQPTNQYLCSAAASFVRSFVLVGRELHMYVQDSYVRKSDFSALRSASIFLHIYFLLFHYFTDEKATMNAFATRFGTKLMAPALVGAASGLTLYHASPAFGTTVHAATKPAVDLKAVKQDIADLIEDDAEKRGDGTSLTVCIRFLTSYHHLIAVVFLSLT